MLIYVYTIKMLNIDYFRNLSQLLINTLVSVVWLVRST
jgi:hypothetical protein